MSNNVKGKTNQGQKTLETNFGKRKVVPQHFSRLVSIPKDLLLNWNKQEAKFVDVKLVEENGQRFIKLTPIFYEGLEET